MTTLNPELPVQIRIASPCDTAEILKIYEPYISTTVTMEEVVPTYDEFRARISKFLETHPVVIATHGEEVIGYAYSNFQAVRSAYRYSAEMSVYLKQGVCRRGLGSALYELLEEFAHMQNIQSLTARVTSPNPASKAMHLKQGYEVIATQKQACFKCGQWLDVDIFVKAIGDYPNPAPRFVPFPEVFATRSFEVYDAVMRANDKIASRL